MTHPTDLSKRFLELHRKGNPLLLANAWDRGTARLLASLGFEAFATTSAGHAGTRGRRDGRVTRDEALAHAQEIAAATPLPVNADLERCFAVAPEGVAETLRLAGKTGIAGASVEDSTGDAASPMHPQLAAAGVARISVGSTFYNAAMGALVEAANEWREQGTHGFWQRAMVGSRATRSAFEG